MALGGICRETEQSLRLIVRCGLLVLSVVLTGCAYAYEDADGTRHLWGIGHLYVTVPRSDAHSNAVVSGSDVVGLGVVRSQDGVSLVLGAARERRVEVGPGPAAVGVSCLDCSLDTVVARPIDARGGGGAE